jgi:hypothetical protein
MQPTSLKTSAPRTLCALAFALSLTACSSSASLKSSAENDHVVLVSISSQSGPGVCSATLLKGTTTALTAAHCLEDATAATIEHQGVTIAALEALVAPDADLALMVFPARFKDGYSIAPLSRTPTEALAIGWDKGTDLAACELDQVLADGVFRFPCGLLPGASGGPVLAAAGIVGVISTLGSADHNSATALTSLTNVSSWDRIPLD